VVQARIITLYDTRAFVGSTVFPAPEIVDLDELEQNMRRAMQRFWLSERRMPAAIVIPLQLARNLDHVNLFPLIGELYHVGVFDDIPLLARESYIDPLFLLL
jgi:hypothetical protein